MTPSTTATNRKGEATQPVRQDGFHGGRRVQNAERQYADPLYASQHSGGSFGDFGGGGCDGCGGVFHAMQMQMTLKNRGTHDLSPPSAGTGPCLPHAFGVVADDKDKMKDPPRPEDVVNGGAAEEEALEGRLSARGWVRTTTGFRPLAVQRQRSVYRGRVDRRPLSRWRRGGGGTSSSARRDWHGGRPVGRGQKWDDNGQSNSWSNARGRGVRRAVLGKKGRLRVHCRCTGLSDDVDSPDNAGIGRKLARASIERHGSKRWTSPRRPLTRLGSNITSTKDEQSVGVDRVGGDNEDELGAGGDGEGNKGDSEREAGGNGGGNDDCNEQGWRQQQKTSGGAKVETIVRGGRRMERHR